MYFGLVFLFCFELVYLNDLNHIQKIGKLVINLKYFVVVLLHRIEFLVFRTFDPLDCVV
jgi:hypothetical protein